MNRRLTMAQKALVESAEARAVLQRAERFGRRSYPDWPVDELGSVAREALVLAALKYEQGSAKSFGEAASTAIFYAFRSHVRDESQLRRRWGASMSSAPPIIGEDRQAEGDDTTQATARLRARLRDARLGATLHMLTAVPPPSPEYALMALHDYPRTLAKLEQARATLPADQAAIIHHHICGDEAITAVAERLGCSRSTVHRKLNAALETLREELVAQDVNPLSA